MLQATTSVSFHEIASVIKLDRQNYRFLKSPRGHPDLQLRSQLTNKLDEIMASSCLLGIFPEVGSDIPRRRHPSVYSLLSCDYLSILYKFGEGYEKTAAGSGI